MYDGGGVRWGGWWASNQAESTGELARLRKSGPTSSQQIALHYLFLNYLIFLHLKISFHPVKHLWSTGNQGLFLQTKCTHTVEVTVKLSLCPARRLLKKKKKKKDKSAQIHCNLIRRVCLKSNCKWKRNPTLAGPPPLTMPINKKHIALWAGRWRDSLNVRGERERRGERGRCFCLIYNVRKSQQKNKETSGWLIFFGGRKTGRQIVPARIGTYTCAHEHTLLAHTCSHKQLGARDSDPCESQSSLILYQSLFDCGSGCIILLKKGGTSVNGCRTLVSTHL